MLNFYFLSEFSSKFSFDLLEDRIDPGIQSADDDHNANNQYIMVSLVLKIMLVVIIMLMMILMVR